MGQFSWLDCRTEEQVLDDVPREVYVLVPKEFGGGRIRETCYDGYGHFGGQDIYDLVADWNREFVKENPDFILPFNKKPLREYEWYEAFSDLSKTREEVCEEVRAKEKRACFEYRFIGIDLACWDEDNAAIKYPIKITHTPNAVYEKCNPSLGDPNQGWKY
jgi:hypothetical protein